MLVHDGQPEPRKGHVVLDDGVRAGRQRAPLPYAWSRANRTLMRETGDQAEILVCPATPSIAIAEVRRHYGAVALRQVSDAEMDALLSQASADAGDAASVVGAAENEVDLDRLMQDVPEVTDLLDAQDDAPAKSSAFRTNTNRSMFRVTRWLSLRYFNSLRSAQLPAEIGQTDTPDNSDRTGPSLSCCRYGFPPSTMESPMSSVSTALADAANAPAPMLNSLKIHSFLPRNAPFCEGAGM